MYKIPSSQLLSSFTNAVFSIAEYVRFSKSLGRDITAKAVQSEKAYSPNLSSESSKITDCKDVQLENAYLPTLSTLFLNSMFSIEEQF